jgi:hypothetical protein
LNITCGYFGGGYLLDLVFIDIPDDLLAGGGVGNVVLHSDVECN